MQSEDITIMICGNLHPIGLEAIPYYLSKSLRVVYSTWKPLNTDEELILTRVRSMLPDDDIIVSDYANVPGADNRQNIYYQMYTWNQAAKRCQTSYCIKMRTSCRYENMDPFLEKFKQHPDKIICISMFFRPCDRWSYCPGDHVMAMRKDEACKLTEFTMDKLTKFGHVIGWNPEEKIGADILHLRGYVINKWDVELAKRQMKEVFEVVDINLLSPTYFCMGSGPYTKSDNNICITDISQV